MEIRFDALHVIRELKDSILATERSPNLAQLSDPEYWVDDLDENIRAEWMRNIDNDDFFTVPLESIDKRKIPSGLFLVGDQGVYLMSNASRKISEERSPCYAYGINPNVDAFEDWWHMKRESCGPDDGVDFLDEARFSAHISKSISSEKIEVVGFVPKQTNDLGYPVA